MSAHTLCICHIVAVEPDIINIHIHILRAQDHGLAHFNVWNESKSETKKKEKRENGVNEEEEEEEEENGGWKSHPFASSAKETKKKYLKKYQLQIEWGSKGREEEWGFNRHKSEGWEEGEEKNIWKRVQQGPLVTRQRLSRRRRLLDSKG